MNGELNLEEGSAKVTLTDIYAMFYLIVEQNQKLNPDKPKMAFDLKAFKRLPKKVKINFLREGGKLYVWIPKEKKSKIALPSHEIVTSN